MKTKTAFACTVMMLACLCALYGCSRRDSAEENTAPKQAADHEAKTAAATRPEHHDVGMEYPSPPPPPAAHRPTHGRKRRGAKRSAGVHPESAPSPPSVT